MQLLGGSACHQHVGVHSCCCCCRLRAPRRPSHACVLLIMLEQGGDSLPVSIVAQPQDMAQPRASTREHLSYFKAPSSRAGSPGACRPTSLQAMPAGCSNVQSESHGHRLRSQIPQGLHRHARSSVQCSAGLTGCCSPIMSIYVVGLLGCKGIRHVGSTVVIMHAGCAKIRMSIMPACMEASAAAAHSWQTQCWHHEYTGAHACNHACCLKLPDVCTYITWQVLLCISRLCTSVVL